MKTLIFVFLLFLSSISFPVLAQVQQVVVPYTLADRDRAIQTEAKLNGLGSKFVGLMGSATISR